MFISVLSGLCESLRHTEKPRKRLYRERDVAFDKVGLIARNPFDELRLRRRSIVAPSMVARVRPAGSG